MVGPVNLFGKIHQLPLVGHNNQQARSSPLFFFIMRLNLKVALLVACITVLLVTLSIWNHCANYAGVKEVNKNQRYPIYNEINDENSVIPEEIDCNINNGDYTITCLKEGEEVYVPFSFIHKYFEIYGKLNTFDGLVRFEWTHSYGKVYHPKHKYNPRSVFMHFENYNVEVRERVKCISAIEGVPLSTQWESQGYFYPTQIAQFGLSHYSKNITEPEPRQLIIEDSDQYIGNWIVPVGCTISRLPKDSNVMEFSTDNIYNKGIQLEIEHATDLMLSVNILLYGNSSLTVILQFREKKEYFNLHYLSTDVTITAQDNNIYHGVGSAPVWRRLTRDLFVDLQKGLSFLGYDKSHYRVSRSKVKISKIILRGQGTLDNLTISSSEHINHFYDAANWFVRHQDKERGGWPNPVRRRIAAGFEDLEPGWYSAMGQGHALSVLARAYYHSGGNKEYLNSALLGLKPFKVLSSQGGVLAKFMDVHSWYEEYPTTPPSFVLNGFIYSLLGLYDLMTIAPAEAKTAEILYREGLSSLKRMLMIYDTGSGTTYDLRHVTLKIAPNLARWDYHATHVNQLLLLSTIDNDGVFSDTAQRWIEYMSGKRAPHN
ncbi:D-glucuronyl C5-epimerase B [Agrilus planipennis]|uniref:heparosan-N-sulfate-glucuronate 5-epimerase n=1 Tax=Agrilus planipennis TaxID=224129 RepID=A0A1W4WIR8_AGRPL|nr:D-glucuronyl C5-epimerase B [Agrilus planipennis]